MAQKFHAQVPPCLPIYANVVTARQQMCRHRTSRSGRQATAPRTSITDVLAVRPTRHYHRMLVRSEGGRISRDFKGLSRWAKKLGAFRAYRCLSGWTPKLAPRSGHRPATKPLIGVVLKVTSGTTFGLLPTWPSAQASAVPQKRPSPPARSLTNVMSKEC